MLIAFPLQQWLHERAWLLRFCIAVGLLTIPVGTKDIQTDSAITTTDIIGLTFLCVDASMTFGYVVCLRNVMYLVQNARCHVAEDSPSANAIRMPE
jgi:hypothetical protein